MGGVKPDVPIGNPVNKSVTFLDEVGCGKPALDKSGALLSQILWDHVTTPKDASRPRRIVRTTNGKSDLTLIFFCGARMRMAALRNLK